MKDAIAGPRIPVRIPVYPWPRSRDPALAALRSDAEFVVIGIATPDTTIRHAARVQIRSALRTALGALLGCPEEQIPLVSAPAQPLRVDMPGRDIGLSVSHEAGLTLAAISQRGAIGIDLMRVGEMPDWHAVAADYLGRQACQRIADAPDEQRMHAFAVEWTRNEAQLKCLGMELEEWSPELERRLACCRVAELDLPQGWVGSVATRG